MKCSFLGEKTKGKDICTLFLCSVSIYNLSTKQLPSRGILLLNIGTVTDM